MSETVTSDAMLTAEKRRAADRRERRIAHYEEVVQLRAKGLGFRAIARLAGLSRATVHAWIRRGMFPERAPRMQRHSLLDTWTARIDALHAQGVLKAIDILHALREEGYRGSYTLIKRYCRTINQLPSKMTNSALRWL